MARDVFSFNWGVLDTGYRWVQGRPLRSGVEGKEAWALTENLVDSQPRGKYYSPLKEFPALFRDFARVDAYNPDAILAFANRYGKLGVSSSMNFAPPERPDYTYGSIVETRLDWQEQILDMSETVALWDLLQNRDINGLKRHVHWQQSGNSERWVYDTHHELEMGQPSPSGRRRWQVIEPVLDLFKSGDVLTPAMFHIQRWINEHLDGHVAPQLLFDLAHSAQVLFIVPSSLIGAMWLQFAQAVAGNKEFRACKECGRWIEMSHRQADGRTKRREFCSDACKSKDYRKRKDRAAQEAAAKSATPKKRHPAK